MIHSISRDRFERQYQAKIPNPEISARHWFEDTVNRILGFVAFNQSMRDWVVIILKKHRGQYRVWRHSTMIASEREALDSLLQLFGLTDRGYREALAEREFLTKPGGQMEFVAISDWAYDPSYDQATKAQLDGPLTILAQEHFAQMFPQLQMQLRNSPGQKSAVSIQAFPTSHTVLGTPVLGMFCLVIGLNAEPSEIRIYVGSKNYIEQERNLIVQHWQEIESKPGVRMQWMEGH